MSQETHSSVSDIGVGVLDDDLLQLVLDMLEDRQQLLALLDLSAVAEKMFDDDDLNAVKDQLFDSRILVRQSNLIDQLVEEGIHLDALILKDSCKCLLQSCEDSGLGLFVFICQE